MGRDINLSKLNKEVLGTTPENLGDFKWQMEVGAKIRGKFGVKKGNDILRSIAEINGNCKLPFYGRD